MLLLFDKKYCVHIQNWENCTESQVDDTKKYIKNNVTILFDQIGVIEYEDCPNIRVLTFHKNKETNLNYYIVVDLVKNRCEICFDNYNNFV